MKIAALYHLKGGVGKTAATVNLAALAARAGIPTLVWDLDPQGAASWMLRAQPADTVKPKSVWAGSSPVGNWVQETEWENLSLIPADLATRHLDSWLRKDDGADTLATLLAPLSESYALCLLDCPPSLSHLAENVFAAADRVLLPTVPTHLSLRAVKQVLDYFTEHQLPRAKLRAFWSLADRRRGLHRLLIEQPPKTLPKPFKAVIPYASGIEKMGEHRAPIEDFDSSHPAAEAYRQLWKELKADLKP
ncbi:MAG: ParA family protein [Stagnimonas sp.]|nr:ParA family protein [Stagnimonas sp.]